MRTWFLAAAWGALAMAAHAGDLSYVDLIKRLTDLERLAILPPSGERTELASSYDRQSRYDATKDEYVNWFKGAAWGGIVRKENGMDVLAEIEGPGCLWRIWSAEPHDGRVKIFLDGAAQPVVDLPFCDYFNGKAPPFNRPGLVYITAEGFNNFIPIPFAKSCKIVAEPAPPSWRRYYHFTYTRFPPGTSVRSFHRDLSEAEQAALDRVDRVFTAELGRRPGGPEPDEQTVNRDLEILPGQTVALADLKGPRAITAMRVRVDTPRRADEYALRELALSVHWDQEPQPAIWAPLGDFFGTALGTNHYRSLPMGCTDEGFYSYWYMPFASRALVELCNDGRLPRRLHVEIQHAALKRPADVLGRFHAKWHRPDAPASAKLAGEYDILRTTGCGRYCGTMIHVWNPKGGWWGEGAEKFYVDGEKFPSTFGTGSEDYIGYAWGAPKLFSRAYHAQTLCNYNVGNISIGRWHIVDNVPFQKSFRGTLEDGRYAFMTYWYLSPGGEDPYLPQPLATRLDYYDTSLEWKTRKFFHLAAPDPEKRGSDFPISIQLDDFLGGGMSVTAQWEFPKQCAWKMVPSEMEVEIPSDGSQAVRFRGACDPLEVYPTPTVHFQLKKGASLLGRVSLPLEVRRSTTCRRASQPPAIDGRLNDPAWKEAPLNRNFIVFPKDATALAAAQTSFRALYDDRNIYLAVECQEPKLPSLVARKSQRDDEVWLDDSVEVFLDPGRSRKSYVQFVVNSLGAIFDGRRVEPGTFDKSWDGQAVVSASKAADCWQVEMAIPFRSLDAAEPRLGDCWGLNINRNRFAESPAEASHWSLTHAGFHEPENFGDIVFQ